MHAYVSIDEISFEILIEGPFAQNQTISLYISLEWMQDPQYNVFVDVTIYVCWLFVMYHCWLCMSTIQ